jgi:chromosome partitioning protein
MVRILAIANQKGGVGKTTTTLNLGLVLARKRRVLLVDLDPQASLTASFGFDSYRLDRSGFSLLMYDDVALSRALRPIHSSLALVPGSVDLATASIKLVQGSHPLDRLRKLLRENRMQFDDILIDTPPGINVLTVIGLLAADAVLIPAQCNHAAMLGIRAVMDVSRRVREQMGNPDLKVRGIVPTFYDPHSLYTARVLEDLRALFPNQVLKTMIPYDVHVADAPYRGRAVVQDAPDSPGAQAYVRLVEELDSNSSAS